MAVAADVPGKYDVVINGQGYVFADSVEPSLPFRTHRAIYDFSPPFVERSNVSGQYGDNQQDFFLTLSQNDWSLGDGQRWFRSTDADRSRRYWSGSNVDPLTVPGQVTLRPTFGSLAFAAAVLACAEGSAGVYTTSSTNLYLLDSTGTITDKGAHGLGAAPSQWGLTTDSSNVFVTTTSGGTVGVRKMNSGGAWSTFSATGADSIAFLDNTLYGFRESNGDLIQYDTAGNVTSLFTWRDGSGNGLTGSGYRTRLRPYGGRIAILRTLGVRNRAELWQYDSGPSQVAEFPANFVAKDMEIVSGIILVSGYIDRNIDKQPAIYYYASGSDGLLWKSNVSGYTNATWPALAAYGEGIAFTDDTTGNLMQYNIALGGVHAMGTYTVTNATPLMAGSASVILHTRNATTAYYFPTTTVCSSGTVVTSLVDFENSLQKSFRGIKVDFDAPAGSTVNIEYQVDSVTGSWTTLQTGATSGVEYPLTGVSGHAIAARVTLNKGSSSAGPALKRVYFRAAPQLPQYRSGLYILDCTGTRENARDLRNGMPDPKTGYQKVTDLLAAAQSTTPISITDRLGTYTGYIDLADPEGWDVYEVHPNTDDPENSGCYLVRVKCRQV